MTVSVAERAVAWPTWLLPAPAVEAWLTLSAALDAMTSGPPCAQDPEAWFASRQSPLVAAAVEGCKRCAVMHLCAAYAVAAGEREGVWGGLTVADRRAGGVS